MAYPEYKQMSTNIIHLKNNLKRKFSAFLILLLNYRTNEIHFEPCNNIYLYLLIAELRKEANESFSAHRLHITKNPNNSVNLGLFSSSPIDKEKAVQEAEKVT